MEITSCGLNGGPLCGKGEYPAAIACHLTSPTTTDSINYNNPVMKTQTRITEEMVNDEHIPFVTAVEDGTVLGYKYFRFEQLGGVVLTVRGAFSGTVTVSTDIEGNENAVSITVSVDCADWTEVHLDAPALTGDYPLYLHFSGKGSLDVRTVTLA